MKIIFSLQVFIYS